MEKRKGTTINIGFAIPSPGKSLFDMYYEEGPITVTGGTMYFISTRRDKLKCLWSFIKYLWYYTPVKGGSIFNIHTKKTDD